MLISRAERGALALIDDCWIEAIGPAVTPADQRGTGDSMTAAVAVGIARGLPLMEAMRLGVAAGTVNASRRGLGTGHCGEIERLAARVELHPVAAAIATPPTDDW